MEGNNEAETEPGPVIPPGQPPPAAHVQLEPPPAPPDSQPAPEFGSEDEVDPDPGADSE